MTSITLFRPAERTRVRLSEAERLLAEAATDGLPQLDRIARSAGFAGAGTMDRAFRRWHRTTSYEYWLRRRAQCPEIA
ncbi:hypothetical protein HQQ80_00495 [Microbacteriaceae bacterium VKM Ac-2855]|nr:hypothetical protein [Microbacteriaceae bacterium VKM Ac-2855]